MGHQFTDEEVDELYREAPIDKKGNFNYNEFMSILKHGAKDKDDGKNFS
jgi:myosin regulatory light chain 12